MFPVMPGHQTPGIPRQAGAPETSRMGRPLCRASARPSARLPCQAMRGAGLGSAARCCTRPPMRANVARVVLSIEMRTFFQVVPDFNRLWVRNPTVHLVPRTLSLAVRPCLASSRILPLSVPRRPLLSRVLPLLWNGRNAWFPMAQ